MKYFIVVLACIAAASAQNYYRPYQQQQQYNNQYNSQYNQFGQYNKQPQYRYQQYSTPRPTVSVTPVYTPVVTAAPTSYPVPVVAKVYNGDARSASIVKYDNTINPDGSFSNTYETENGIANHAEGALRVFNDNPPVSAVVMQGSFSWTAPNGEPVAISYIADENGYRAEGPAIPVGPEVPAQIARALAYTAQLTQKK